MLHLAENLRKYRILKNLTQEDIQKGFLFQNASLFFQKGSAARRAEPFHFHLFFLDH